MTLFSQSLLLSRLLAYAKLPQPIAAAYDMHIDVICLVEVPCLLILSLAGEYLLNAPHACDRLLTCLPACPDDVRIVVAGHFVDIIVFLAAQALLVES